ncbi:MAG: HAD-IA family hydrolase [Pseudomonadota bacterium]
MSPVDRSAALLLDLDGTLLDTAPDMAGALNALGAEARLEPLPFTTVRPHVSHGATALVKLGFPDADADAAERLRVRFLELYAANLLDGTCVMNGFDDVLGRLESRGVPWGVVTNKPGWLTDPLMERIGLRARAACIVSGDTVAERKPHPLPLLHAADLVGRPPTDFLYVGDAERDIQAGRAAGMRTLAAGFGYLAEHEDPRGWRPDGVIARPAELLDWLARGGD